MESKLLGPLHELTDAQKSDAQRAGVKLTDGKNVPQLRGICIALCVENMRLLLQLNAQRAMMGLEPLPGFEVQ